jgi:BirA family biotin operon repressor/biotin-[acetyl-CoA-carboxylase] ligase
MAAIKWPNDVVVDGRKLAGILAEMEADAERVRFVVAGIGVNLNSTPDDFPPELRDKAVALCAFTGARIDRVAFTNRLLSHFEERYDAFSRHGFAAIHRAWEALSCLTGQRVQIDDCGQRSEGVVVGMSADGTLCLRDTHGERSIVAGDVTVIDGYGQRSRRSAVSDGLER